jgi:hypothetical protein
MPKEPGIRFSMAASEKVALTRLGLLLLILTHYLKEYSLEAPGRFAHRSGFIACIESPLTTRVNGLQRPGLDYALASSVAFST